jgi:hypothetical protein
MIYFKAWEIRNSKIEQSSTLRKILPEIYFRQIEKIMLYLTKHILQWIVITAVKYWFIILAKTRKWSLKKLPKIYKLFKAKNKEIIQQRNTFLSKAILESKIKIKRIKEKVKRDHA